MAAGENYRPTPTESPTVVTPEHNDVISADNYDRLFPTDNLRMQEDPIIDIQYSPAGKYIIAARESGLYVYDAKNYSLFKMIPLIGMRKPAQMANKPDLAIQPNGELIAVLTEDNVQVLSWYSGDTIWTHEGPYADGVFSPDGQTLVLIVPATPERNTEFSMFEFWSSTSWTLIRQFEGQPFATWDPVYSADGSLLVVGGAGIKVYTSDGQWITTTFGSDVSAGYTLDVAVSPVDNLIAELSISEAYLRIWRFPKSGYPVLSRRITLPDWVFDGELAFSPYGTRLAVGVNDRVILYDTSSWNQVPLDDSVFDNPTSDPGFVTGLIWSPDGATLLGFSNTGVLRVWNALNGEVVK